MKKKLSSLREVRNDTIWRTFERLGYSYKARRRKAAVAEKHKPARLAYCDWVEKQDQEDLNDWSYVDGTSIYLATHEAQHLDKQRGSLGRSVWRLTDGSDSLEDKNVGGSLDQVQRANLVPCLRPALEPSQPRTPTACCWPRSPLVACGKQAVASQQQAASSLLDDAEKRHFER